MSIVAGANRLRWEAAKSEWQKKKRKRKQLWFKHRETNSTGLLTHARWKIILWLWTRAEIDLHSDAQTMSNQHPCAKLGKEGWQRREKGGGREGEKAKESDSKTKDRLRDNEWCKPDDLSVSTIWSHSHACSLFFPHTLSLSPSGPINLLKLRRGESFFGPSAFVTSYRGVEGCR